MHEPTKCDCPPLYPTKLENFKAGFWKLRETWNNESYFQDFGGETACLVYKYWTTTTVFHFPLLSWQI